MTVRKPHKPSPHAWEPLERAEGQHPVAIAGELFMSNRYRVHRRYLSDDGINGWVHLSIRHVNRTPIRDWRHFQRIKNELVGADREAFEIYPAEARLIDEANQYHLWVMPKGTSIPMGFNERLVGDATQADAMGAKQRDFAVDDPNHAESLIPSTVTSLTIKTSS